MGTVYLLLMSVILRMNGSLAITPDVIVPGDVIIAGIFNIMYPDQEGKVCDDVVDMSSIMEVEAVRWAIQRLNEASYIPQVKIGFHAYKTCALSGYAEMIVADIYKQTNIVGIVGPTTSYEADVTSRFLSSLPKNVSLPQIAYSSTGSFLSNKEVYRNFYRVIPNDKIQMKEIASLLKRLEWNYIYIIHSDDQFGKEGTQLLQESIKDSYIYVARVDSYNQLDTFNANYTELHRILNAIASDPVADFHGIVFIGGTKASLEVATYAKQSRLRFGFIFVGGVLPVPGMMNIKTDNMPVIITITPLRIEINEFVLYLKLIAENSTKLELESKINPFLKHLNISALSLLRYDLRGRANIHQGCQKIYTNVFLSYAVKATYVMAKIIKDVHKNVRPSKENLTVLSFSRQSLLDQADKLDLEFKKEFRPSGSDIAEFDFTTVQFHGAVDYVNMDNNQFEILQFQRCLGQDDYGFVKLNSKDAPSVQSYQKASIAINQKCENCIPQHEDEVPMFVDGDYIIVVLFPIHDKHQSAMKCAQIRKRAGLDVALSAKFAVEEINKEHVNVGKFGLLLLDTCNNPLLTIGKILDLHQDKEIPGLSSIAKQKLVKRIVGYVGGLGSSVTLDVATLTTKLKLAHVGCCSSAVKLSDREEFPYFARVSSSLKRTAELMVNITFELGIKAIQILYSEGVYGTSGKDTLLGLLKLKRICIIQTTEIKEFSNDTFILNRLRNSSSEAKVILSFVRSHIVYRLAEYLQDNMDTGEFLFIGSDGWGAARHNIRQFSRLEGSIIITEEIPDDPYYKKLEEYILYTLPMPITKNTWITSYIQEKNDCYFPIGFDKTKSRLCEMSKDRIIDKSRNEKLDPWSPYMVHAMFALAKGVSKSLKELCNMTMSNQEVCNDFRERPNYVVSEVNKALYDEEKDKRYFDSNGDGNFGFGVYNLQKSIQNRQMITKNVGTYDPAKGFTFYKIKFPGNYKEISCINSGTCSNCLNDINDVKRTTVDIGMVKTVTIVILVVFILLQTIVLAGLCRKIKGWKAYKMASSLSSSERYNTIHDLRQNTIRTISSEVSLASNGKKTVNQTGTPTTPRSTRSHHDTPPPPCRNHSSCIHVQTPPNQTAITNPDIQRLQQETHAQCTPTIARRFNSAPLPDIPLEIFERSNSTPYVLFNNSRRQNSEPIVGSSKISSLLTRQMSFSRGNRKESFQDNGYITPLPEYAGDEDALHFFIGNRNDLKPE